MNRENAVPEAAAELPVPVKPKKRRVYFGLALVFLIASAAYFGYFGVAWLRTTNRDTDFAEARESALKAGEQGIESLTTMDYTKYPAGMSRWLGASTGTLHDTLVQDGPETMQKISAAKSVSTGRVLDATVTALDSNAGTATVIAAVEINVKVDGAKSAVRRNRFRAELSRADGAWKIGALAAVPVGAA